MRWVTSCDEPKRFGGEKRGKAGKGLTCDGLRQTFWQAYCHKVKVSIWQEKSVIDLGIQQIVADAEFPDGPYYNQLS